MTRKNYYGYHFDTSLATCNTTAYVENLAILIDNLQNIQSQVNKLQKKIA